MKTLRPLIGLGIAAMLLAGCDSGPETQRGAAVGAASGAVIGGIIGHQSGETGAGAAIGAAAGGLAGGAYGKHRDDTANRTTRDSYGFTSQDYLALLTSDERAILDRRAQGTGYSDIAVLLTDQEKANLRARAQRQQEIGR
ncbi:MAG TPA: YMGG-like glycine zipper-containing protein [Candidatus Didemnitutus sp.]|nr:YMGG-like glycine zipper-containing protein [Candidatus Didemnitutus sp.]